MLTIEAIEEKHRFKFPLLYKKLWNEDKLNYTRVFDAVHQEAHSWIETLDPALKENPPILLHTGEYRLAMLTPEMMTTFEFPPFWDVVTHHFIPFAKTFEGNYFAFYDNETMAGETPVVEIWDEMDDTVYYAKNFEDFVVRQMLESAEEIDKDDIEMLYENVDTYVSCVHTEIEMLTPYMKSGYITLLKEIFSREIQESSSHYFFVEEDEIEKIIEETLGFEKMDESFSHEV